MLSRYLLQELSAYQDFAFRIEHVRLVSDFAMHGHNFHEVVVVVHGSAVHRVNDESHPIGKGDVFVLGGMDRHSFEQVRTLELYNVMFDRSRLLRLGEDLKNLPGFQALFMLDQLQVREHGYRRRLCLDASQLNTVLTCLEGMLREYNRSSGGVRTLIMSWFVLFVGSLSRSYMNNPTGSSNRIVGLAAAAARLQNTEKHIRIDALARTANMSRRHFQRVFTDAYGMSPTSYRIRCQLDRACMLLRQSDFSVAEITEACGLDDSNYFSRLFKKHMGTSPVAYRKEHAQS